MPRISAVITIHNDLFIRFTTILNLPKGRKNYHNNNVQSIISHFIQKVHNFHSFLHSSPSSAAFTLASIICVTTWFNCLAFLLVITERPSCNSKSRRAFPAITHGYSLSAHMLQPDAPLSVPDPEFLQFSLCRPVQATT